VLVTTCFAANALATTVTSSYPADRGTAAVIDDELTAWHVSGGDDLVLEPHREDAIYPAMVRTAQWGWVAWLERGTDDLADVYFACSDDEGLTYTEPTLLSGTYDFEDLDVGAEGHFLRWSKLSTGAALTIGTRDGLYFAKSSGSGCTMELPDLIYAVDGGDESYVSDPAIDSTHRFRVSGGFLTSTALSHTVVVAFQEKFVGSRGYDNRLVLGLSTDSGNTFAFTTYDSTTNGAREYAGIRLYIEPSTLGARLALAYRFSNQGIYIDKGRIRSGSGFVWTGAVQGHPSGGGASEGFDMVASGGADFEMFLLVSSYTTARTDGAGNTQQGGYLYQFEAASFPTSNYSESYPTSADEWYLDGEFAPSATTRQFRRAAVTADPVRSGEAASAVVHTSQDEVYLHQTYPNNFVRVDPFLAGDAYMHIAENPSVVGLPQSVECPVGGYAGLIPVASMSDEHGRQVTSGQVIAFRYCPELEEVMP